MLFLNEIYFFTKVNRIYLLFSRNKYRLDSNFTNCFLRSLTPLSTRTAFYISELASLNFSRVHNYSIESIAYFSFGKVSLDISSISFYTFTVAFLLLADRI